MVFGYSGFDSSSPSDNHGFPRSKRATETGREMVVDCRNKKMREQFINYKLKQYGDRIDVLKKSGIDHIEIRTSESVTTPLIRYFKSRGKR